MMVLRDASVVSILNLVNNIHSGAGKHIEARSGRMDDLSNEISEVVIRAELTEGKDTAIDLGIHKALG